MRPHRVWLVVAAVLAASGSPRGQSPGPAAADYGSAVNAYVTGHDAAKAVASLMPWTAGQFEAAVEKYRTHSGARLDAASVLHLEIAVGVVTLSPGTAARHLALGERLVRSETPLADNMGFAERWYVAAASTFLMINDAARALPFVTRGLKLAPASPDLRLMTGIVDEMAALATNPDHVPSSNHRGRVLAVRTQSFMRARDKLAKLVADEPRFTRARIRLGRVLWMLDDRKAALVELLRAQSEAREPEDRYLVAMFLGALYEQQGNLVGARVSYEAALAAAPASQAATVALGFLDVMAGRPDRTRELAQRLLSAPPVADEWWSYKNGGFAIPALASLRSRVWQ